MTAKCFDVRRPVYNAQFLLFIFFFKQNCVYYQCNTFVFIIGYYHFQTLIHRGLLLLMVVVVDAQELHEEKLAGVVISDQLC